MMKYFGDNYFLCRNILIKTRLLLRQIIVANKTFDSSAYMKKSLYI